MTIFIADSCQKTRNKIMEMMRMLNHDPISIKDEKDLMDALNDNLDEDLIVITSDFGNGFLSITEEIYHFCPTAIVFPILSS